MASGVSLYRQAVQARKARSSGTASASHRSGPAAMAWPPPAISSPRVVGRLDRPAEVDAGLGAPEPLPMPVTGSIPITTAGRR